MPFAEVNRPVHMPEAFGKDDDASVLSQAAALLILGSRLRGDAGVAAPSVASLQPSPAEEDADLASLGVPHLRPTFGRIDSDRLRSRLQSRYRAARFAAAADPGGVPAPVLQDLAGRLATAPEDVAAAELMEASLNHPREIVRVASAAAYFDRSSEPQRVLTILRRGVASPEPLVRAVAATALGHIAPEDDALRPLTSPGPSAPRPAAATRTLVIVHGTWAANSPWWQPGGDFFTDAGSMLPPLQRTAPLPPLPAWDAPYGAGDYYRWTGGYSDAARSQAAQDLSQWVTAHKTAGVRVGRFDGVTYKEVKLERGHNAAGLDLITHSHGGNVAFLATQLGVQVKEIVALSCPVHFPKYVPAFTNVKKIVSVRVHLDLVIRADRGGQRFNDPRIAENVIPVWFDHLATHDPAVWTKYAVPAML